MSTLKIDHLGIAVNNLEEAAHIYELLGLKVERTIDLPERGVRVAFIPVGDSTIELVQPTSSDSAVARFLAARGEGLHHLALRVADVEGMLTALKEQGVRLIDETPRPGAEGKVAFLHPKSTGRVLIELVEVE